MSATHSLADDRDASIAAAVSALRSGDLVVVPTDTVYGLAVDAFAENATSRVFDVKKRPRALALPVLVARPRQAWALASVVPRGAPALADEFWPGALTMILPLGSELDWDLGDADGTIAVRIPDHPDLLALLERVGPLAVTSANISGEPTATTIEGVRARLGDEVAVYLDGGPAPGETASTIVDMTADPPVIVREGAIDAAAIKHALARVE